MSNFTYRPLIALALVCAISACGKDSNESANVLAPDIGVENDDQTDANSESGRWKTTDELNAAAQVVEGQSVPEIDDADDIPYPIYPNGLRYGMGDENGLKIVLFQTEDSFEEVDAYYQTQANMPRLSAMSDYVRYSAGKDDNDPWDTENPGIVIHQFNSESERDAVGADEKARTNIIMSFE